MPVGEKKTKGKGDGGTWLVILVSILVPVGIVAFFAYQWIGSTRDLNRLTTQFVQRQNNVLAYDAIAASRRIADLFEGMARDVETLELIPRTAKAAEGFYRAHTASVTHLNDDGVITVSALPLYSEVVFLNDSGTETVRITDGKPVTSLVTLGQCVLRELCDQPLRKEVMGLKRGELRYGTVMRYYTPESMGENSTDEGATFSVGMRTAGGAVILGLDYRHLREVQNIPVFPYERKKSLLTSYSAGNYVYFVDDKHDFITHPKRWHVTGIDVKTGEKVPPVQTDADEGRHPLNVSAYKGEKLKLYFERLLQKSFLQRSVDIFRASNLKGVNRVLSVAPILFSKGQYAKTGVYGWLILGCSVDYFEEPKETYVPYY